MKTITFYSYKGGVGRTLALSNIAKRLSEFGKKVCVIDFDLEAPGLHHKFGRHIDKNSSQIGIVDYIYEFSVGNKVPENITKYVTKIKFNDENISDIDLITAGNTESRDYWKNLSLINWGDLFYKNDSQGVAFFLDLKQKIEKELKPDFLLIDSRTGITDISGLTMSILADEVVLLAAKNDENIQGIKQVIGNLAIPENTYMTGIPKINFVLSRIPYFSNPKDKSKEQIVKQHVFRIINDYLRHKKITNYKLEKIMVIHSDPELELDEKLKIGYEDDKLNQDVKKPPIAVDYLELFEELTKDVLSESEKSKFNKFRKSELLIEQAKNSNDNKTKIELLNSAILLNPGSHVAYYEIAVINYEISEYSKCLDNIDLAIKLKRDNINYLYLKGISLLSIESNNLEKAEKVFLDILEIDKIYWGALYQLSRVYSKKKELKKELIFYKKILKYYPGSDEGYNAIGDYYRKRGDYDKAFENIYKALEINPQSIIATATLAEINAHINNDREFYKNLELAFSFGMTNDMFRDVLKEEYVYKRFYHDVKFLNILNKYNINIDFSLLDPNPY